MLIIFAARRGVPGDVHDGGPEEVLRRHEEDGEEEAREGHPKTSGRLILMKDNISLWKGIEKR